MLFSVELSYGFWAPFNNILLVLEGDLC